MPEAEGKKLRFSDHSAIESDCLEMIAYKGNPQKITMEYPEFSAVCPFSGLPDIANVIIEYIPDKQIVELKSLKYYFISFRNVGIYQEEATHRIYEDLKTALQPKALKVSTIYNIRGGIETTCEMGTIPETYSF
jgi:7-cyano-7-deazaguanine reductase